MIRNRETLTDHGNASAREAVLDIATSALGAVHPSRTVPRAVERDGSTLRVNGRAFDLDGVDEVVLLGAGKGSAAVVEAVLGILGDRVIRGVVAEKRGQAPELDGVGVLGAGHPLPDETSREAGRRVLDLAESAGPEDLVIACVTGGASAQCIAPAGDLSLADVQAATETLLSAGLRIEDVNAVRKHLSRIKGGHLAVRAAPAPTVTLVLVDEVAGQPWGPTVGDETTFGDALAVLETHGLAADIPDAVLDHLRRGRTGDHRETPRPAALDPLDTVTAVLADARDVCEAALDRAAALGYEPMLLSASIEGESRAVAPVFAGVVDEILASGRPVAPPCVLVSGGETTVTLPENPGEGGPNQEFGLAFALETAGLEGVTALALDTDGTDGPTTLAGALVDDSTVARLRARGVDPRGHLRRHDTAVALRRAGDAVETEPTGTNVMDLRLVLVEE